MSAQQGAGAGRLEAEQVRSMFDRIARIYDPLNTAMTAGLHHRWRERAADLAQIGPGSCVLDVATGTGDLAIELARRVVPGGEVVGSDFSEGMLARARVKAAKIHTAEPRFEWGDALELPYADDSFDAATVGFGARNFSDLPRGLAEMARVVRPGGRVVVLEFTTPTRPPFSTFYSLWFDRIAPILGRISDNPEAYEYLSESINDWPSQRELADVIRAAGWSAVKWRDLSLGVVSIHVGRNP